MGIYDQPIIETYESATGAFGATTATKKYIGPRGKQGLVKDIEIFLTADAVGTTTVPEVCVGLTSGSSEYARWRLGTAVGTGYTAASTPRRAFSEIDANSGRSGSAAPSWADFTAHIQLETAKIPANTAFFITMLQGAGGTPAGTGFSRVTIHWF
jgi:hypothetical protein